MLTSPPLVVDLDGTLICTDTVYEMLLCLLLTQPWKLVSVLGWFLTKGRAYTKMRLLELTQLTPRSLPYNIPFLRYIQEEAAQGRYLVLATGTPQPLAEKIAEHVGVFQEVIGTTEDLNMVGHIKQKALLERFGPQGFDYAGDSLKDIHVWEVARKALLVRPKRGVLRQAQALFAPTAEELLSYFPRNEPRYMALFFALRLPFWSASLCLLPSWLHVVAACCLSSGTFILGDILRIAKERSSPSSSSVFADGRLTLVTAFILAPILLLFAFLLFPHLILYFPYLIATDLLTRSLFPSLRWAILGALHISALCLFFI